MNFKKKLFVTEKYYYLIDEFELIKIFSAVAGACGASSVFFLLHAKYWSEKPEVSVGISVCCLLLVFIFGKMANIIVEAKGGEGEE